MAWYVIEGRSKKTDRGERGKERRRCVVEEGAKEKKSCETTRRRSTFLIWTRPQPVATA
jgi:hypothetical protein